jgi:hypothetical protein
LLQSLLQSLLHVQQHERLLCPTVPHFV